MRNVLDKSCTENRNTNFMFSNVFLKIVSFMRVSKNVVEPKGPQMTSQYTAYVLRAG